MSASGNDYYTPPDTPSKRAQASSRVMRNGTDYGLAAAITSIAAYYLHMPAELTPPVCVVLGAALREVRELMRPVERRKTTEYDA